MTTARQVEKSKQCTGELPFGDNQNQTQDTPETPLAQAAAKEGE